LWPPLLNSLDQLKRRRISTFDFWQYSKAQMASQ
jgi:hypothetical protein